MTAGGNSLTYLQPPPVSVTSQAATWPYCSVTIGNAAAVQIPIGSVVIPDANHAYYLKLDPTNPAEHCKAELMIKMPGQALAVSGSSMRNPGNISLPPSTTLAGVHVNPSGFGDPVIAALFNLLGKLTDLMPAWKKDNCIILTYGMDKADTTRRALGLTPEQAAIAAPAFANQFDKDLAEKCNKQYDDVDIPTCNGVSKARGPAAAAKCFSTAMERYSACLRKQPLPPLNTWSN